LKSDAEISALLAQPNHAIVGTNQLSGPPQLSVVWYIWDGISFSFSTTKDRVKYRNLQRDPRISLLINDAANAWYFAAYGDARIIEDTETHAELAHRLFERYLPGQEPGEMARDPRRIVITVEPERMLTGS
jgi:PPOX class probable F420-dependent enzyme